LGLQPAPSAIRTVEVVRYLAERPGEQFAVADLARRLGQSRATCQAVLLALEPADWVRRSEGGYTLGAGLIAVGAAAQHGVAIVGALRSATAELYDQTGCEILGYLPAGDQLINVSRVGSNSPLSVTMVEGQAFPLAPPYGLAYAAWDQTELDKWMARAPGLSSRGQARLKKAAAIVRELGYSVILDPVARREFKSSVDDLSEARRQMVARALYHHDLLSLDDPEFNQIRVSLLSAPVFGAGGKVVALIGIVFGVDQPASIPELAASLLAATRRLSARFDPSSRVPDKADGLTASVRAE
jgi:DNA-binding IclR family transcriptional regulator